MHAYTGSVADCKLSYATFSATIFPSRSDCFGTTNPPKSSQIEAWRLVELTSTKELERNPHGRNVAIWPSGEDFLLPPSATVSDSVTLLFFSLYFPLYGAESIFSCGYHQCSTFCTLHLRLVRKIGFSHYQPGCFKLPTLHENFDFAKWALVGILSTSAVEASSHHWTRYLQL